VDASKQFRTLVLCSKAFCAAPRGTMSAWTVVVPCNLEAQFPKGTERMRERERERERQRESWYLSDDESIEDGRFWQCEPIRNFSSISWIAHFVLFVNFDLRCPQAP